MDFIDIGGYTLDWFLFRVELQVDTRVLQLVPVSRPGSASTEIDMGKCITLKCARPGQTA